MKKLLFLIINFNAALLSFGQDFTGQFYSPNTTGMYTDAWLNLHPQSGATASNNWNIYHQDGSSLFSLWFASTQPYVQVGYGRQTNLLVNGKVGIGTGNPTSLLHLSKSVNDFTVTTDLELQQFNGYSKISGLYTGTYKGGITFSTNNQSAGENDTNIILLERMRIACDGSVGIGTTSPDAKLAVKGQVHAQEVKVDLNGAVAPDYVFSTDYKLASLEEIKTYIDENKHLPEVPSAKEMEKNGVQLGEMNMLLLKKIEELTLYVIGLKKENEETKKENQLVRSEIQNLKVINNLK